MSSILVDSPFLALSAAGYTSLFGASGVSPYATLQSPAQTGSVASLFFPSTSGTLSGDTLLSLLSPDQSGSPASDLLQWATGYSQYDAASAYASTPLGTLATSQYNLNTTFDENMAAKLATAAESASANPVNILA